MNRLTLVGPFSTEDEAIAALGEHANSHPMASTSTPFEYRPWLPLLSFTDGPLVTYYAGLSTLTNAEAYRWYNDTFRKSFDTAPWAILAD